jgi:hypothetical protein
LGEDEYGKAWTQVEANSEEEARAKLNKAFDDGKEYELDWDYYAKGGGGTQFDLEIEVVCREVKDE